MYNAFYELQREPFHVTPDPDFLFPSPAHKEALAAIIYGIEQRKGFVAITGEVGVGKTTILRSYLDFADRQNLKLIYVYNSDLSFDELVTMLLKELDVEDRPPSTFQAVSRLHEALIDIYRQNQTVVLIIDEAQNMPVDTLESLRMLSNLETVTEKLIQIMLIGQPEFDELLQEHRLRQLRQRIAIHARIGPLNFEDSIAYLEHRLAKVSLGTKPVFTKNALKLIAEASQGIPRNLNIISDNALITGYGYQQRPVNTRIVKEVLADRGFAAPPDAAAVPARNRGRALWIGTGMGVAAAVAAIVAVLAMRPELTPGDAHRVAEQQPATSRPAPAPEPQVASKTAEVQSGTARESAAATPPAPAPQPPTVERAPAPPEPPRAPPAPPVAERTPAAPVTAPQPIPNPPRPAEVARAEPPRTEARPAERPTVTAPPPVLRSPPAAARPPEPATSPPAASAPQPADAARAPAPPRQNATPPAPVAPLASPPPARPTPTPSPQTAEAPRPPRSGSTDSASAETPPPQPPTARTRRAPAPIPLAAPPAPAPRPAPTPEPAPAPAATRPTPSIAAAPGPSIAAVPAPPASPAAPSSVMLPSASGSGVAAASASEGAESLIARPLATLPPPTTQTVRAVRTGDSLWTMAEEVYGFVSPSVLRRVQDANPQIRNINVLAPGQEVVFPRVQETPFGRGTTLSESLGSAGRN